MAVNSNNSNGGISFTGALTLIFIVLKLLKIINWSWIWVLSPIWITFIILVIICIFSYLITRL